MAIVGLIADVGTLGCLLQNLGCLYTVTRGIIWVGVGALLGWGIIITVMASWVLVQRC